MSRYALARDYQRPQAASEARVRRVAAPQTPAPLFARHSFLQTSVGRPQTELTVNMPSDAFEQEADAVAVRVMGGVTPGTPQRKCDCGNCGNCGKESETAAKHGVLMRAPEPGVTTDAPGSPPVAPPLEAGPIPLAPPVRPVSAENVTQKLMPLAVPAAWAIVYNAFTDEEAVVTDGQIMNDEHFTEDLLSVEQLFPNSRGWRTKKRGYILDLGWYPSSSPNGTYRLALLKGDWDNLVCEFSTRDRYEVRDVLHLCFDLIGKNSDTASIKSAVTAARQDSAGPKR